MALDLLKLSGITHETTVKIGKDKVTVRFRGVSVRAHRELEQTEVFYLEDDVQMIRKPEYLAVFVMEIVSGENSLQPDIEFWLDADPVFLNTIFEAVTGAQNLPKAMPSESATTS